MQRELGLDQRDLPHDYVDDGVCTSCEVCGREKADTLHGTKAGLDKVERAANYQLVTEKGT